jgi:hypothetical protein
MGQTPAPRSSLARRLRLALAAMLLPVAAGLVAVIRFQSPAIEQVLGQHRDRDRRRPARPPRGAAARRDAAMYEAKAGGRARHALFHPSMHVRAVTPLAIETDLRRAIDNHQLELHYQPTMWLDGRQIVGVEALVRWRRRWACG